MTQKRVLSAMALFPAAHAAVLCFLPQLRGLSALFVLTASLAAAAACYRRSTQVSGPVRRKWDFLASALALWSIGELIFALKLFFPAFTRVNVLGPEFYFLVYGIPVLLAISTSNEERDSVLFILIDSFQAVFTVALLYLEIVLAQSRQPITDSSDVNLSMVYGGGTWLLAAAAGLRLLARPRSEEKSLYRILFAYLLCFALLATPWRGSCVLDLLPIGIYGDLFRNVPFLMLTAGCLLVPAVSDPLDEPVEMNSFALVLNSGSPILFTLSVLALGALVARQHFGLGISAIALSLVIYCFRAALLQSAYIQAQHALTRSQHALREANSRLKQLSLHDALTGLPNRRHFDQVLEMEWNRALRNRRPLSLVILDVDCFKDLNDRYGHPVGDECLTRLAIALQTSLRRAGEVAARYGGEEFAAILPDVDLEGAALVAETMREAVIALQIAHESSQVAQVVTVSLGAATVFPTTEISPGVLIRTADEALYKAKRGGRNRVEVAEIPVGASH